MRPQQEVSTQRYVIETSRDGRTSVSSEPSLNRQIAFSGLAPLFRLTTIAFAWWFWLHLAGNLVLGEVFASILLACLVSVSVRSRHAATTTHTLAGFPTFKPITFHLLCS